MSRAGKHSALLLAILLLVSSCNTLKRLKDGEKLYTGGDVRVEGVDGKKKRRLERELKSVLRPTPNTAVLGARYKLWIYQVTGENSKGLKRWLRRKLGEAPVLYDPLIPGQVSEIMANRLVNLGYFDARVTYTTIAEEKTAKVSYTASVTKPYTIASVTFPPPRDALSSLINETEDKTLLKPGRQYNLEMVRDERSRIEQYLRDAGYYFFNGDNLLFIADSTKGDRTIAMRLTVKPETPRKALTRYRIKDIYVFSNYRLRDSGGAVIRGDTLQINGYHYVVRDSVLKPSAVLRAVELQPDIYYSRKLHTQTLGKLMSMGIFHYVNIQFTDTIIDDEGLLDAHIYLSPMRRHSVQLELQLVSKSNNYTGPAATASYRNRNLLGAAELFVLNFNGNFESQITGFQRGFNSYEFGGSTQLFLPGFVAPIRISNVSSTYMPKTRIDLSFRNLNRVEYFNMHAAQLSYGYQWKESARKDHELMPFSVNFAKVRKSTQAFQDLLNAIPFLRRSFEEQFTIGGNYGFTYNSFMGDRADQYYFNGLLDVSGNALYLAQSLAYGRMATAENPFRLFNYRYSQYTKVALDGRYMRVITPHLRLVNRVIAGVGFSYLNSNGLPYIKQFFSGGANSIRAFLPRTVGPGVYVSPDSAMRRGFLDQAGDIKLEGNSELRFTIISVLKGALFIDAGNVWLMRPNDEQPGGVFRLSEFHRQLAVGGGFGLRVDVTYFVLRFDLGMPFRKPYLPYGERWVLRKADFGDGRWRAQNLVLNIAIGYPF